MTNVRISVRIDPTGAHWQLGPLPPPCSRIVLVEWQISPSPPDAGIPAEVANVLAAALVSVGRVTFPCSSIAPGQPDVWQASSDDFTRLLPCRGWLARLGAYWRREPTDVALLSTRNRERACTLFDDPAFPWWLQGQIVLLSAVDKPPPAIDRTTLFGLFADDWAARFAALSETGIAGIMRPGVDGDVAALLFSSPKQQERLVAALEREIRQAGFPWVSEAS